MRHDLFMCVCARVRAHACISHMHIVCELTGPTHEEYHVLQCVAVCCSVLQCV